MHAYVAIVTSIGVISAAAAGPPPLALTKAAPDPPSAQQHRVDRDRPYRESVAVVWNAAFLDAVRAVRFAPMLTARGLAITHTSMYDAWAAYDAIAMGTVLGA